MNISILTVFPELYEPFLNTSLIKRAREKGTVNIKTTSFFSYAKPTERIDAPTFGHGAGMLLKPTIVAQAIIDHEQQFGTAFKIFFSPQGKKLTEPLLKETYEKVRELVTDPSTQFAEYILSIMEKSEYQNQRLPHLMLICGRYEGMDARVEEAYADLVISIGDYVVMGGDIPAMVFLEGFLRLVPGVVGRQESVIHDSFTGPFLDHPEYTEPVVWHGQEVPPIIRSGNHAAIQKWQLETAAKKTVREHLDWFRTSEMTTQERDLGASYIPPHYAVLMHNEVLVKQELVEGEGELAHTVAKIVEGTTSITSLDIHDIARSARTYGLAGYFLVTSLADQERIAERLLNFWRAEVGIDYNPERHEALQFVQLAENFDRCLAAIEEKEGQKPLVIATSARPVTGVPNIGFNDQAKVWASGRPILLVFGTGRGLSQRLLQRCDYILPPIKGFTDYNHLSVRSAAAVIFDRWLAGTHRR